KHFSSIVILRFVLAFVYIFITMSAGVLLGYNIEQLGLLALLGLNQFLITFILYLRSNISGLHLFKTDSLISVLDRVFMIAICGVLLWTNIAGGKFKIEWFVYAQTVSYIITTFIALLIVFRKAQFKGFVWNYPFFVMIIKKSLPYAILILLMTFYNRLDSVMLERMLGGGEGAEQAGIYASAYRLLDATNMIAYLFSVILLPMFSRMIKYKDSVEKLVKLSFTLLFIMSITISSISFFYAKDIMGLLYKQHIESSASVFRYLMTGFIAISTTYIFGTLLTANGSLKQLNIIAAFGMLINLGFNLLLIPIYKATGATYSSLITQFITAIMQVIVVQYLFRFKINYKYLLRLFVFIMGLIAFSYLSKGFPLAWYYNIFLLVVFSLLYCILLKLISLKSVLLLFKKEQI
ncbi:MAG: polysaccharide biosynthesis C-terminal domain-containing protein, partial [Bacteroidales bacterium]|nr:polysaccharide biosynthesis C-terminal domain-containing protein [Bacteroidales bacterium]